MVDVTSGWCEPHISVFFMLHLMWFCYHIYVCLMCYMLCGILCVPRLSFVRMKCYVLCYDLCINLCAPNMLDLMLHLLWTEIGLRTQPSIYFYFDRSPWIGWTTNIGVSISLTSIFDVFHLCFVRFAFMWDWVLLDIKIHIMLSAKIANKPILEVELHRYN